MGALVKRQVVQVDGLAPRSGRAAGAAALAALALPQTACLLTDAALHSGLTLTGCSGREGGK